MQKQIEFPNPTALIVGKTKDGWSIYRCPECGHEASDMDCDIIGADDECLFCTRCHCEFRVV